VRTSPVQKSRVAAPYAHGRVEQQSSLKYTGAELNVSTIPRERPCKSFPVEGINEWRTLCM